MQLAPADLAALVRKYEVMRELRQSQHDHTAADARDPLRALSAEFPGALRELDVLDDPSLARRLAHARAARAGGAPEPWLLWMHAYHRCMSQLLAIKRALGGRRELDGPAALARELGPHQIADQELVQAVARPARGRLNEVAFAWLGAHFGVEPAQVRRVLFPRGNSEAACASEAAGVGAPTEIPGDGAA